MEQAMINLMDKILTDEDISYINTLESSYQIEDDIYAMINDIKLFFFKKGFKTGIDLLNFCDNSSKDN